MTEPSNALFIAHKEKGEGVILSASIKRTKASGTKYIEASVALPGADPAQAVTIGRLQYTSYVLRRGLGEYEEDEEDNVASLVGEMAQIRYEHQVTLDGKVYPSARIVGVGL